MPISFKGVRVICGLILLPPLLIAASIHPSFRHLDGPIDWPSFTHFTCSSLSLNSSSSYLFHSFSLAPIPTIINVPHNLSHQPIFFFFLIHNNGSETGEFPPQKPPLVSVPGRTPRQEVGVCQGPACPAEFDAAEGDFEGVEAAREDRGF